jgi:hypothetical protein
MKYDYLMTAEDHAELKAIEHMADNARKLRAKFMAKLRQRAWRQRK